MTRLAGRRILVTGAASGIGRATAELFGREGAAVAMLDRDGETLQGLAPEGCAAVQADLADAAAIPDAVARCAEALGGLDGVVNAAGLMLYRSFAETTLPDLQRIMAVNLTAPFLLCHAALPWLVQGEETTIVNIISNAALVPQGGMSAYATSKGGLMQLTRSLAVELAPGIRVNAVSPGATRTPMAKAGRSDAELDALARGRNALGTVAEPLDVARAVLFLTSRESCHVTGITLPVDGGHSYH